MALVTGIDHAILAVDDLSAAAAFYDTALGLRTSGGGVHPQFGTANRIVVLGDDYLELISAAPGAQPQGFIGALLTSGVRGCAGFALATADPDRAAVTMRERGLAAEGPAPGRLEAEGGFSRGWRTVRLSGPEAAGLPFLIRHESSDEERRRLLAGPAGLTPHPIGATHIAALVVAVPDLDAGIATYARAFDLHPAAREADPMLAADTATLPLPSGAAIVLAAPQQPDHGPIAASLRDRGPGLLAVTLAVRDLAAAVRTLRGRGLGVRVDEPEGVLVAAQLNHRQTFGARLGLTAGA